MILAHRIALDPTVAQRRYFAKAAGCARFVWNWALERWNADYASGKKPSGLKLQKEFNHIKYQQYSWMKKIHRDAHARPFINLQKAFSGFFKETMKHPQFHKKGRRDSFYVANDRLTVESKKIQLPVIGWVRMREELRFKGKIMGATVSRTADRWFISIQVDVGDAKRERTGEGRIGVDLGLNHFAVLSNGEKFDAPKPLHVALRALRRHARRLSKRQKGSARWRKQKNRVARIHRRVVDVRKDFLHKLTTKLCRENQAVVVEDLHVAGMVRNRKLARAISDVGFGEFRRQMEYKSKLFDVELVVADRFMPSSKTCSKCGAVKEILSLKERIFHCDLCGFQMDRDENAAQNLATLGLRGSDARGQERLAKALDESGTK